MSFWHVWWSRARSLRGRSRQDRDLSDEVESYVSTRTERHRRDGLPPDAARRAALLDIGGVEHVKERTRDERIGRTLAVAWRDATHGLRVLRGSPGYAAALVGILALGVGANGAVFSLLRAVLLQPLPYHDPARLVMVWTTPLALPDEHDLLHSSARFQTPAGGEALAIHDRAGDVLADTATYLSWQGNLDAQLDLALTDRVERLRGMLTTPNFFDVLGVQAAEGRVFTAADESRHEDLIVLSDALWHRDFGGDSSLIGRPLRLLPGRSPAPRVYTVIGVLPPGFRFTYPQETEAWVLRPWAEEHRDAATTGHWTVARLAPGVALDAARARVKAIPTLSVERKLPIKNRSEFTLQPMTDWVIGETRPAMLLLGGVAALLLLLTCATVASALFVRMTERQREFAVRSALGASRGRLVRQLLAEGFVLSAAGAAVGALLAALLTPVLCAFLPTSIPRADEVAVNGWIFLFFAAAAGVTTIGATLLPAWRGAHVDAAPVLKRASSTSSADPTTARWRHALVTIQTSIATALLVVAALLLTSFWRLNHVPLGFDGTRVLTAEMRLTGPKYRDTRQPGPPPTFTPAPALVFFPDRLTAAVRALPGVIDAGVTSAVPFRGVDFTFVLNRVGATKHVVGHGRYVDPGYFSVLNVPLVAGRLFSDADTLASPHVVVISQSYARAMFGDEHPLGRQIQGETPLTVVGVVGDLRYQSFDKDPQPAIYFARSQEPNELICLVARLAPNAGDLAPAVRRIVRQIDPDVPVVNLTTVDQIVSDSVADRRFYTTATSGFASIALILTLAGLAVVVSRAVVERRRELAIRAALGAGRRRLLALVIRQGMPPIALGVGFGLTTAALGAHALQQFLFQTSPRASIAYASVASIVLIGATIAAFVPARRASAATPASVLRGD